MSAHLVVCYKVGSRPMADCIHTPMHHVQHKFAEKKAMVTSAWDFFFIFCSHANSILGHATEDNGNVDSSILEAQFSFSHLDQNDAISHDCIQCYGPLLWYTKKCQIAKISH